MTTSIKSLLVKNSKLLVFLLGVTVGSGGVVSLNYLSDQLNKVIPWAPQQPSEPVVVKVVDDGLCKRTVWHYMQLWEAERVNTEDCRGDLVDCQNQLGIPVSCTAEDSCSMPRKPESN